MSKRKFGDRKDAKRIRNINGLSQILLDLKPNRCDSDVFINQKMDVTALVKYIETKKKQGLEVTYFHAFVLAIAKTFYNRPKLNRFIANRHIYEHNDIVISFIAKVTFDDKSEEIMVMIPVSEDDNLESISKKIKDKIANIREKSFKKEGANNAIDVLGKLPNIIRIPIVCLFKWCDKHGILPASLVKDNLYYSSMIISNLGSIKCGAIYHNLTCFGTCSSLATIGEIKEEVINYSNGTSEVKKICEFGINFDERIADGYYFAKSIKLLQYIFDNPELLEDDASSIIDLGENR